MLFICNGEKLSGIVHKTSNIVIQKIQEGTSRDRCFIIGSGYTLNVNEDGRVTWHDPAMIKQSYGLSEEITVYTFFFTPNCVGLEKSAVEIAEFVNPLFKDHRSIYLIGHSKCGLCMYKATEFLKGLVTLVTISTPFKGTIIVDQDAVEKKVDSKIFLWLYRKIFSNHNVDKDIIPGSDFLKGLKNPYCKTHLNFTSKFNRDEKHFNLIDLFLMYVDKTLELDGDGVVPFASQKCMTKYEINTDLSHASSLSMGVGVTELHSKYF